MPLRKPSDFEKIENLSNNIEQIRESIQDLIRKEDLDNASDTTFKVVFTAIEV